MSGCVCPCKVSDQSLSHQVNVEVLAGTTHNCSLDLGEQQYEIPEPFAAFGTATTVTRTEQKVVAAMVMEELTELV